MLVQCRRACSSSTCRIPLTCQRTSCACTSFPKCHRVRYFFVHPPWRNHEPLARHYAKRHRLCEIPPGIDHAIPTRIGKTDTTHPSVPFALTPENKERVLSYHDMKDVFTPSQGRAMLGKVQRRAAYVFRQTGLKSTPRSPKKSRKTSKARSGNRKKK